MIYYYIRRWLRFASLLQTCAQPPPTTVTARRTAAADSFVDRCGSVTVPNSSMCPHTVCASKTQFAC